MTETVLIWAIVLGGSRAVSVLAGFVWDLVGPSLCDALFPIET